MTSALWVHFYPQSSGGNLENNFAEEVQGVIIYIKHPNDGELIKTIKHEMGMFIHRSLLVEDISCPVGGKLANG